MQGRRPETPPPRQTGAPGDLDRQARLARRLLAARPVYGRVAGGWIETVGEALDLPVVLGSYGPTVADKRELRVRAGRNAAA